MHLLPDGVQIGEVRVENHLYAHLQPVVKTACGMKCRLNVSSYSSHRMGASRIPSRAFAVNEVSLTTLHRNSALRMQIPKNRDKPVPTTILEHSVARRKTQDPNSGSGGQLRIVAGMSVKFPPHQAHILHARRTDRQNLVGQLAVQRSAMRGFAALQFP